MLRLKIENVDVKILEPFKLYTSTKYFHDVPGVFSELGERSHQKWDFIFFHAY